MELNETEEIINPRPTMVPLLILTSSFSQQLERKKNSISLSLLGRFKAQGEKGYQRLKRSGHTSST